jgi:hypothetical protein
MTSRSYTDRTLKLLWGRSAGRCAIPDCRIELFADATDYDPIVVIGEIAHVAAIQDGGPRAAPGMGIGQRNDYDNLILLCRNCHAVIDGQPGSHSIEWLKALKSAHELWVRSSLPERGRALTGWTALSLQGDHPTDLASATAAISPDFVQGEWQHLRVQTEPIDWDAERRLIAERAQLLLAGADPFDFRLAVFPLAPVSACIALGYSLTNRPHVRLFQYQRDERTWAWPRVEPPPSSITLEGFSEEDAECEEVGFVFHLSSDVRPEAIAQSPASAARLVHVRVSQPATTWLIHPAQLTILASLSRQCFEQALQRFPNAVRWHIFFAGPAPAAVVVGQQINPTMTPPVHLYEFTMRDAPPYRASICLGGAAT